LVLRSKAEPGPSLVPIFTKMADAAQQGLAIEHKKAGRRTARSDAATG